MKKVILILAVLFTTVSVRAQDTVQLTDSSYLIPFCKMPDSNSIWRTGYFAECLEVSRVTTSKPLTVYGLGMVIGNETYDMSLLPLSGISPLVMALYDDEVTLTDTTRVFNRELKDAWRHHKIMDLPGRVMDTTRGIKLDTLLEFYYDEPIRMRNNTIFYGLLQIAPELFKYYRETIDCAEYLDTCGHLAYNPGANFDQHLYIIGETCVMPLYFPILTPPTLDTAECVRPPAPEMNCLDFDRNRAYVNFEVNPEVGDMEVVFGPYPGDPDDYVPIHFLHEDEDEGPWRATLDNLDSGACYAAWLRHQCYYRFTCHGDTTIWTDWSEPLVFNFCDTISDTTGGGSDPNEGIAEAGMNPITLHPNPTSGELRIECGELSISTVELLDLQGRVLERQEPSNPQSSTFNLQSYPTGTYIVRITTTEGTFTRRVSRR